MIFGRSWVVRDVSCWQGRVKLVRRAHCERRLVDSEDRRKAGRTPVLPVVRIVGYDKALAARLRLLKREGVCEADIAHVYPTRTADSIRVSETNRERTCGLTR